MNSRFCSITPCRDEAKYAEQSIESVLSQSRLPDLWVIVNDGSTDTTKQILDSYAAKHQFIRVIDVKNRGFRKLGGGVIDAFYQGYNSIDPNQFEFICKHDLDLILPTIYFEKMIEWMHTDPRIGTCSGKPYFKDSSGELISECCGDENSVGMVKFYRTKCFMQIGGFVREVMWDGIDGHRCRMFGWKAESRDDESIRFLHLRPMGTSDKNWWVGRVRHGAGQYFMGTSPLFILASAIYRMTRPPVFIGGLGMLYGYFTSYLSNKTRYSDLDFRKFLTSYHWNCLLMGKNKATQKLNESQAAVWKP